MDSCLTWTWKKTVRNKLRIKNILRGLTSIALFFCIFVFYHNDIKNWQTSPDTFSYVGDNYFSNPWGTWRTPGMSLFWSALGAKDELKKATRKYHSPVDLNTQGKKEEKINSLGKKLVLYNIVLIGASFSLLCFSLSSYMSPIIAFLFSVTCVYIGATPAPKHILADLPACSLTVIFVSLSIFYSKYRKNILLFFICICAVFACLIKPGMFFLPLIAGCIVAYELLVFIRARYLKKALITFCIGLFLILGTLSWPILLYIQGGIFVPSQLSSISNNMFAVYLLQEGDDHLFTDSKQKAFVADLIAHKSEADAEIDKFVYTTRKRSEASKAHIYLNSVNVYGWRYFASKCISHGYNNTSGLEYARLSKKIANPIIKKHFDEYLKTVGRSFLSAFGAYKDLQDSLWWRLGLGVHSLGVFIVGYIFLFCAIFFGAKKLQFTLVLLTFLHVASVTFMSIGHAVLARYLGITEWSFILALEVGAYSLLLKIFQQIPAARSIMDRY